MRFISYYVTNAEESGLLIDETIIPLKKLNSTYGWNFPIHLDEIFSFNQFFALKDHISKQRVSFKDFESHDLLNLSNSDIAPLYRYPSKIWGIGLNYRDHASDLAENTPSFIPASFLKTRTTIIGHGENIYLPKIAEKITGEAELGIIFGSKCKDISQENWISPIAGFTCIIDMTAESILRKNPRYLTLSKNFDTFFSFGPVLVTPEEVLEIYDLEVATVLNGEVYAKNTIKNMTFPPDFLVSFHSKVMTFLPGDIISTGTPRAVTLKHGDIVECIIEGFPRLTNPVK